ncbi:CbtB domain-containing protein [Fulvimarina sp. 2208YS6-2-32]|uniref:CbtB domain-containing protein n=1 Tax=Fulvimarina uroteuthidis TaxID=3098149 RepID=A0ABU5I5C5_9HYPH|nr:CbtB domain-containing protein [Fulvimarina sp. 2208YS6-2-32]MDY8110292.1 CbtB domain-containing protein [Fulvimarina sp. 2208YS6-2-32]
MNTLTTRMRDLAQTRAGDLASIAAAAILGLGIIWTVGMAQAASLHDAAHDVRHTTGFPCH